jgi:vitamin K-dependent gamma-carboxylase
MAFFTADRARRGLAQQVDPAGLVAFRVLFGALVAFSAARFLWLGWVERCFVTPRFFFHYWGFSWVTPLGGDGMRVLFGVMIACGVLIALGLLYRLACATFFLVFTYVELCDVTNYLNHYYLVSLLALLLTCLPLHRAFSIDARLRPALALSMFPAWWSWLLRGQVAVVYFFAAIAKATPDWLFHGQPLGIWLSSRGDVPVVGPWLVLPGVALAMSWGGFLYDLTIPLWLSLPRTRPLAYAAVIGFHAMVGVLFPIGMFPWIMIVATTVFFEPSWPRAVLARFVPRPARPATAVPASPSRWALGLAAVYLTVQLLVPLRAFAYGGNVLWHEQGMRWSWRVMAREKNGSVTFRVRARGWSRERLVSPSRYLTAIQEREMVTQPDLILQLAHHVGHELAARGMEDVEVRVDALASLNGRPMAPLIDPEVDLMTVEDSFWPATWISPAPTGAPPAPRARRIEAVAEVTR